MNEANDTKPNQWLGRFLLPNRTDGLIFFIGWLSVSAWVSGVGYSFWIANASSFTPYLLLLPWGVSCVGCAMGFGCVLGWGRRSKRRFNSLLIACILSFVIFASSCFFISGFNPSEKTNPLDDAFGYENLGWLLPYITWPLFFTTAFLATWLITLTIRFLPTICVSVVNRLLLTRTKMLIGAAIILFVVGSIQNILNEPRSESSFLSVTLVWVLLALFWVSAYLVFVFWPSWAWSRPGKPFQKFFALLPWIGIIGSVFQFQLFLSFEESVLCISSSILIGICFFSSTYLVSQKRNEMDRVVAPAGRANHPSIWGFAVVVAMLTLVSGLIFVNDRYDFEMLLADGPSVVEKIELARQSRLITDESNGQIHIREVQGSLFFDCKFDETTDANVLKFAQERPYFYTRIENIQPHIDTDLIRSIEKNIFLQTGELTRQQLADFADNCTSLCLIDISIQPDGDIVSLDSNPLLVLYYREAGKLSSFLRSISSFGDLKQITITSNIADEDWPAVVAAATKTRVHLTGEFDVESLLDLPAGISLKNIMIEVNDISDLTPDVLTLLLETEVIVFFTQQIEHDAQTFWDLVYSKSRETNFYPHNVDPIDRTTTQTFAETVVNYHWAFERDENENITGLLLPADNTWMIEDLDGLSELKTLSFNAAWILNDPAFSAAAASFSPAIDIAKLSKLERLYFSQGFLPRLADGLNLTFLGRFPNFVHLQIPSSSSGNDYTGFDQITTLKSLTLFGRPSATVLTELASLSKLKKLTVVYSSVDKPGTKWRNQVAALLPGVTIAYVDGQEWKPDTTPAFEEYLKQKSGELRAKLKAIRAIVDESNAIEVRGASQ